MQEFSAIEPLLFDLDCAGHRPRNDFGSLEIDIRPLCRPRSRCGLPSGWSESRRHVGQHYVNLSKVCAIFSCILGLLCRRYLLNQEVYPKRAQVTPNLRQAFPGLAIRCACASACSCLGSIGSEQTPIAKYHAGPFRHLDGKVWHRSSFGQLGSLGSTWKKARGAAAYSLGTPTIAGGAPTVWCESDI